MATANGVIKTFSPKQIPDNLNVLGGFDKLPNLNQNYIAKLTIEPNGNFVMVDGNVQPGGEIAIARFWLITTLLR